MEAGRALTKSLIYVIKIEDAPVAQLDRAADFESVGREFESHRACQVPIATRTPFVLAAFLFSRIAKTTSDLPPH